MLGQSDARTLRQFLMNTFDGLGSEAADKILKEAELGMRVSPAQAEDRPRSRSCTRRCST